MNTYHTFIDVPGGMKYPPTVTPLAGEAFEKGFAGGCIRAVSSITYVLIV